MDVDELVEDEDEEDEEADGALLCLLTFFSCSANELLLSSNSMPGQILNFQHLNCLLHANL